MATLVVAIIFASVNHELVTLNYLLGKTELWLSAIVFGSVTVGLLIGLSLEGWLLLRQRARIRKLEALVKTTESELNNLRNMPLKDLP